MKAGSRFTVSVSFTQALTRSRVKVQFRSNNAGAKGAVKAYRNLASKLVTGRKASLSVKIPKAGVYRLRVSYFNGVKTAFVTAVKITVTPKPAR